jgi:putative acetyltransferase
MAAICIKREDILSQPAQALIAQLNEELLGRYPEQGATHFRLDPDETATGRGAFLVAFDGETAVGCGAIRRIGDDSAELKRMYVAPSLRRQGIARQLVAALEAEALLLNVRRLVLETGVRQPDAIAAYERFGYVRIPAFGEYVDSPLSVCMAKDLK